MDSASDAERLVHPAAAGFGARSVAAVKRWLLSADSLLGLAAVAVSLPVTIYPFGRDQGLYYYIGREWLLRGAIPYRDTLDQKTPLIYALHALSVAVFGENMWAIRLLDGIALALLGWCAARVIARRGKAVRPGTWGAAWLFSSLVYLGSFRFWDTAQCEIWCALFAVGSLAAVLRIGNLTKAAAAGGVLAAIALWFKPPSIFLVAIGAVLLAHRALSSEGSLARNGILAALGYAGGILGVSGLIIGYFAAHGALGDMADLLIGFNRYYVEHEAPEPDLQRFLIEGTLRDVLGPLYLLPVAVAIFALPVAIGKRLWSIVRGAGLFLSATAAAVVAVVVQHKFYVYHWGMAAAGAALFGALAYEGLARLAERRKWNTEPSACAGFTSLTALLFLLSPACTRWVYTAQLALDFASGRASLTELNKNFDDPLLNYDYSDSYRVGDWLRYEASSGDQLLVRGFEPQIYAISGLHYTGRFFWTANITDPRRAYKRAAWLDEDWQAFIAKRPRFVVAMFNWSAEIENCTWFEQFGYRQVFSAGPYCVLERR